MSGVLVRGRFARRALLSLSLASSAINLSCSQAKEREFRADLGGSVSLSQALIADSDVDGIDDADDNCPALANPDQLNSNDVPPGDACELALVLRPGSSAKFVRYQSLQEPVISAAPFALSGSPDLLRVSAISPEGALAYLHDARQRLGVQAPGELGYGAADTLVPGEVLRFEVGRDVGLGVSRATAVFMRLEGSGTVRVRLFDGPRLVNETSIPHDGYSLRRFDASGRAFDAAVLDVDSGKVGLRGLREAVAFAMSDGQQSCPPGFELAGSACVDIDECTASARLCDPRTTCTNLEGSYECGACPTGYRGAGATGCVDVDECAENAASCSPLVTCSNREGGYQCGACPTGYRGDGHVCSDVDECAEGSGGCDPLVTCTNLDGGYACGSCPRGYAGGGATGCHDVDECTGPDAACDSLVECSNSQGGYHCGACPEGYLGTGDAGCVDVDECASGLAECSPLASCRNSPGGYQCSPCPAGYSGDGRSCADVDECAAGLDACSELAACHNTVGGYTCGSCPAGYSGDGLSCVDVDECANVPCDVRVACNNTVGGFTCGACPAGFSGDGYAGCVDVDECNAGLDDCSPLVTCGNTLGSFVCGPCPSGFTGDGRSCVDLDECAAGTAPCEARALCQNTQGGYTCGPCPAGFSGDGSSCTDIDECAAHPCDGLTTCSNQDGSYACSACPDGYAGDGYSGCVDIDECATENGACSEAEACENTAGAHRCVSCAASEVGLDTRCGVGACSASGLTVCKLGRVVDTCSPATPTQSDVTCDGLDDDCDGRVDEDFAPEPTTCGLGRCASSGSRTCVAGRAVDSCTAGKPPVQLDATCDGSDDDCDGRLDDDFSGTCDGSSAQVCQGGRLVDAATCADDDPCNGTEACVTDRCRRTPVAMDDGNACTVDSCDRTVGVQHTDLPYGASCSDGDACNGVELCVPCLESANLLTNASFEQVPFPYLNAQGYLPIDWWTLYSAADTYSFDGSWGLGKHDFGNFGNVQSVPDGQRWVAAWSSAVEIFAQELREPLVAGQRYRLRAKLHASGREDLAAPGGYHISLSSDYRATATRPADFKLGSVGTTSPTTGWVDVELTFNAPAGSGDKLLVVFTPYGFAGGSAYPGLDAVSLVQACAQSGAQSCQRQDPMSIDDANPCTVDSCSNTGGVKHVAAASGTACNGSGVCSAQGECSNRPPVITSVPPPYHSAGSGAYRYQIVASDADGDALTFQRGAQATGSWSVNSKSGLLTFNNASTGVFVVHVQVRDPHGAVTHQRALLQALEAELPSSRLVTQPAQHVVFVGSPFSYQAGVWTTTPRAPVQFAFTATPPSGMTISPTGLVSWSPDESAIGTHEVGVTAVVQGAQTSQRFLISVLPAN
jgi:hypothetical protein